MRSKFGAVFMVLGVLLLCGAVALLAMNEHQARETERASGAAMEKLLDAMKTEGSGQGPDRVIPDESGPEPVDPYSMLEMEIDGVNYVGYITILERDMHLPVLAEMDSYTMELGPCRYYGSPEQQNLVIGAHNYHRMFAGIGQLKPGTEVAFTNLNGTTVYEVDLVEILAPSQVDELVAGEYPLTLFTCNYSGTKRVTVRCVYAGT